MRPPLSAETELLAALVRRALARQPMFTRLADAQAALEATAALAVVDPAARQRLAAALLKAIGERVGHELRQRRAELRDRLNEPPHERSKHDDE
jgi:hypothetical protein